MEVRKKQPSSADGSVGEVYIHAFGCQMNAHEGERLLGIFRDQGYQEAITPASADIIVLHTCAIREHAVHKAISEVGRLARMKVQRPGLKIGLTGCVAQSDGSTLLKRARGLDFVVGTRAVERLSQVLKRVDSGERVVDVGEGRYVEIGSRALRRDSVRGYVTVIEGCDKFCSFCIVPYTRGREYSRPSELILDEVRALAKQGYREVTLLGQTVNAYGRKDGGGGESEIDFPELLSQVSAVDGIARVRFVTSHPNYLSRRLVAAMVEQPKICEYMHLPLQSGSNEVLARMNRGYTVEDYEERVTDLRREMPEVALVSDFIVGFPGESDDDFETTLAAVEQFRFAAIYAFKYSPRPHTRAEKWGDPIPEPVKTERLEQLLALQRRIATEHNNDLVGSHQEILVEGSSQRVDGILEGRTRGNRRVLLPLAAEPGELVTVRITGVDGGCLLGEAVTSVDVR